MEYRNGTVVKGASRCCGSRRLHFAGLHSDLLILRGPDFSLQVGAQKNFAGLSSQRSHQSLQEGLSQFCVLLDCENTVILHLF